MKKIALANLVLILSFGMGFSLFADNPAPSSSMTSTSVPSGTLESMKKLEKSQTVSSTSSTSTLPPPAKPPTLKSKTADYFHPGILVLRNGKWEGSDHLYNLTNNIGVYATIIKPEDLSLAITPEQIKKIVVDVFEKVNINPVSMVAEDRPPLPSFEVEVLIYPIERGYVACIAGSLFESVSIDRVKLDSDMAFQAVTWEKQTLIVGPKNKFLDQLTQTISDVASSFAERFETFERLKRQD